MGFPQVLPMEIWLPHEDSPWVLPVGVPVGIWTLHGGILRHSIWGFHGDSLLKFPWNFPVWYRCGLELFPIPIPLLTNLPPKTLSNGKGKGNSLAHGNRLAD